MDDLKVQMIARYGVDLTLPKYGYVPFGLEKDSLEWNVHVNGAPWMDETRPGWVDELDYERLDLMDGCHCVLGQFVKNEAEHLTGFYEVVTDRLHQDDRWLRTMRIQVRGIDDLESLVMNHDTAVERGFHVYVNEYGEAPGGIEHWQRLTAAWKVAAEARGAELNG